MCRVSVVGRVKTHNIGPKLLAQNPFLKFILKKRHLNGVEVHIFFHFQIHITIIIIIFNLKKYGPWKSQFRY